MKLKVKLNKDKFVYTEFEDNSSETLVVLMSGFSGGLYLPLFIQATKFFSKVGLDVLRVNFCIDEDDEIKPEDAFSVENMSFSFYQTTLKNVLDRLSGKYSKIILVGHSFGAIISISFLEKYQEYRNRCEIVFWDQSHLPWDKKEMANDFMFDDNKKLFIEKETNLALDCEFYNELTSFNSLETFASLGKNACIIAAENSANIDAQKYWDDISDKKTSVFKVIKNTNHFFEGSKSQQELFDITLDYVKKVLNLPS